MERKAEESLGKEADRIKKPKREAESGAGNYEILLQFWMSAGAEDPDEESSELIYERHYYIAKVRETSSPSVLLKKLCVMPENFAECGSSVVAGSFIYYVGGLFSDRVDLESYTSEVHRFDINHPDKGWDLVGSMKVARRRPAAMSRGGKIYVFGGQGSASQPSGEVYDPSNDSWSSLPDPPNGFKPNFSPWIMISPVQSSFIFVYTGYEFYAFLPESQSWLFSLGPNTDLGLAAVFMDDVIYSYQFSGIDDEPELWALQLDIEGSYGILNKSLVKFDTAFSIDIEPHLLALSNRKMCCFQEQVPPYWRLRAGSDTYMLVRFRVSTDDRSRLENFSATFRLPNCVSLVCACSLY